MTKTELVTYLSFKAEQLKLTTQNMSATLGTVVDLSLESFWHAFPWSWRSKQYSLVITTEAELYSLPDDFAQIRIVRDKVPSGGRKLRYLPLEKFRERFPKPTAITASDPRFYSILELTDSNTKKILFFPIPTARTLYLEYIVKAPATIDKIPEKALDGLRLLAESMLHISGSAANSQARMAYMDELYRLQAADSPYGALDSEMLDDSDDERVEGTPIWWVPGQN